MFEKYKMKKDIDFLSGYLKINDILYQEDIIKEKLDEFDKIYREYEAKYMAHIKGYEKYNELYIMMKRIELLEALFKEFPGLVEVSKALKLYLIGFREQVITKFGMTSGDDKYELSIPEIVRNETNARKWLASLKVRVQADETYSRK